MSYPLDRPATYGHRQRYLANVKQVDGHRLDRIQATLYRVCGHRIDRIHITRARQHDYLGYAAKAGVNGHRIDRIQTLRHYDAQTFLQLPQLQKFKPSFEEAESHAHEKEHLEVQESAQVLERKLEQIRGSSANN